MGSDSRTFQRRYDAAEPVNHETFNTGLYTPGLRGHYDRRNDYNMNFTPTADGNNFQLFGSQAMNPTLGGFIPISEIEKKKDINQYTFESLHNKTEGRQANAEFKGKYVNRYYKRSQMEEDKPENNPNVHSSKEELTKEETNGELISKIFKFKSHMDNWIERFRS